MNDFQRRILEHAAEFADRYECVTAIYLFGSVARGETERAGDIDLAVDYLSLEDAAKIVESYEKIQSEFTDWAKAASILFGKPVKFSRIYIDEFGDEWDVVKEASKSPTAKIGKAMLLVTPPKP